MTKSKLYSLVLSLLISFGLWLFVVNNVSREDDRTYYNVPVVMEGESVMNERNLMITSKSANTVSLHLSGARSDLNKLSAGNNLTVKVDLTKIYEPGEKIPLTYTPVYPGDVSEGAITVESKSPTDLYVNVDYRRTKEIPVSVKWGGERSENYLYDMENVMMDYSEITVIGPAAVVDLIDHAEVEVDLTNRVESISESFRYTLCDAEGEPVDAEMVTTNAEEVRVDVTIQRIKKMMLRVDAVYGGGATDQNTEIQVTPETIRVSGGEAVLAELGDTYSLGTINLADVERSTELKYTINLPEGVTNQTGVSEATVSIKFSNLVTKEFTIDNFQTVNLPEGMEAEIINANLTVKVRGPAAQISKLTEKDITAVVDFSAAEVGTATYKATIVLGEGFGDVGSLKTSSVSATVQMAEE